MTGYDWIFHLAAGVIGLTGLIIGTWALFWDRSRGRRRCPKCWYLMEGVPEREPGLWICPECGRRYAQLRQLHRTRRRRRWTLCSFVFLATAGAAAATPGYLRNGWMGAIPSSVLVFVCPADGNTSAMFAALRPPATTRTVQSTTVGGKFEDEVWHRIDVGMLARWQSQVYFNRFMNSINVDVQSFVEMPRVWLAGSPIPIKSRISDVLIARLPLHLVVVHHTDRSETLDLGLLNPDLGNLAGTIIPISIRPGLVADSRVRASASAMSRHVHSRISFNLQFRGSSRVVYTKRVVQEIILVDAVADLLNPIASSETDQMLRSLMIPKLARRGSFSEVYMVYRDRGSGGRWHDVDFAIGFDFDIKLGKAVLGTGSSTAQWGHPAWTMRRAPIKWTEGGMERLIDRIDDVQIVVRSNADMAASVFMRNSFGTAPSNRWEGNYTIQASWEKGPHP